MNSGKIILSLIFNIKLLTLGPQLPEPKEKDDVTTIYKLSFSFGLIGIVFNS